MDKSGLSSLVVAAVIAVLTLGAVLMIMYQQSSAQILPQSSSPSPDPSPSPTPASPSPIPITTFEDCIAAGYPIAESKPRQCIGPDGKTFVEETMPTPSPSPSVKSKKIATKAGELTLQFADGMTSLSGTLFRENPCVEWSIETSMTKDLPPSSVEFHVIKKSTAEICIQVIGKPQEVRAEASASSKTKYKVFLQEEQVFSGTL